MRSSGFAIILDAFSLSPLAILSTTCHKGSDSSISFDSGAGAGAGAGAGGAGGAAEKPPGDHSCAAALGFHVFALGFIGSVCVAMRYEYV